MFTIEHFSFPCFAWEYILQVNKQNNFQFVKNIVYAFPRKTWERELGVAC